MGDVVQFRHMAGEYIFVDTDARDPSASTRCPVWRVEWIDEDGLVYPVSDGLTYFEASLVAFDLGDGRECGLVFRREA